MDLFQEVVRRGAALMAFHCLWLLIPMQTFAADEPMRITGFGLFGNAELRNSLKLLEIEDGLMPQQKIEDGAFLILSRLKQSGYLDAQVSARITSTLGDELHVSWSNDYEPQLDPNYQAVSVEFKIESGILYHYQDVNFSGLASLEPKEARSYFIPDATLFMGLKDKSYSPSIFSRQQKQLIGKLISLGYRDAQVADSHAQIDHRTGAVLARVTIEEGPIYRVNSTRVAVYQENELLSEEALVEDAIYNRIWTENRIRELRNESYRLGFPDTVITSKIEQSQSSEELVSLSIAFEVKRGNRFRIASVRHAGASDTHDAFLRRKTRLAPGDLLNITEVEAAHQRISRTGVFKRVDLSYESITPNDRSVIFNYKNSSRIEWQLLVGYGSYENLRAGVRRRQNNLFGRAHTFSFEAIQSFKSTNAQARYTVPELFGEDISGSLDANFLKREEIAFEREEQGVSLGLSTYIERLHLNLGLDYAFELKESSDPQFNEPFRFEETNIGSLSLRATRNRLDNILYPTSGYEIFASTRYAAEALGGETEFNRSEAGASYHKKLGSRWLLHLSVKGGIVTSPGENALVIPFGERFLIGGENSLRSFRRGEAGPLDSEGVPLGAEAYALFNAELEYPIFNKFNAVVFTDNGRVWGSTGDLDRYDDFTSIGLGFRYKTIVGPIRLEYGRNLDPRDDDPKGTFHFSVGFPF